MTIMTDTSTPATALRFATSDTSLGLVLVATSRRGVCAILMGDDADALVGDLRSRFPKVRLIEGGAEAKGRAAQVAGAIETPSRSFDLPLDIGGTAFQRRVWEAIGEIPSGTTSSYAEIARRIGAPGAARAVARACAANPVAVAVPCHRVVGSDGALSGYRWGAGRKRALLAREAGA